MPQLNKGGKFVFGLSVIHENRSVQIPPQIWYDRRQDIEVFVSGLWKGG